MDYRTGMNHASASAILCGFLFFFGCVTTQAEEWPYWRGASRNAVTTETSGWEEGVWPLKGPAWQVTLGDGATSPIVVGNRVYAMGWKDNVDTVYCLNASTGREVWKQSYPCPRYGRHHRGNEQLYGGPSPTPEYDAATQLLYTLSNDGHLHCWDTRNHGRRVWTLNLYDTYGIGQRPNVGGGIEDYGFVTSPLVHGGSVIVEVGDDEGNLMAFDKRTGQRQWVSDCRDPAGHTGGLAAMTVEGVPCIVVLTLQRLVVVRVDTGHEGQTVASYDWQTHIAQNIPTPGVCGECVVVTTDYNMNKMAKLKISLEGTTLLWEQKHVSKVCGPVIYNNHIYLAWRQLKCIDFATGEQKWMGGSFGEEGSCLVTRDGRLIVLGNRRIALVETADRSPGAYTELSVRGEIGTSTCWPHVAVAGGRLYAKDKSGNLLCFLLAQGENKAEGQPPKPLDIFSFSSKDAGPDFGGAWGVWPTEGLCRCTATFVPGDDAERGKGGSMRIDYQIDGAPHSVALWATPANGALDLTPYDRFVLWAKGEVDTFSLVVEGSRSDKSGEAKGVAECVIRGVTKHWQRFEVPFKIFKPRVGGAALDWRQAKVVAVALIDPPCPKQGSLQIDHWQVAGTTRPNAGAMDE
ncbi:MAG: hypothetical protein AUJ92_08905 [Armatimonadetes bacterium CG2_30_59_28]|nr:MAG: hypothetical protein AUJ92_08905 [Armatimonadetes bacterium CG2_30_59_28]PIU60736.1 MAG: hypothetical protein COS85_22770 [Armatimonadetes bacterium CG07_land_8_20_14_0_80_59_28]PIX43381.1 MAG: hypothetical protein COZ56_07220 [Armatimonadetes bacterium CG_4_8_14_3_um_filter_58_9]